jgi:hypothetical protein
MITYLESTQEKNAIKLYILEPLTVIIKLAIYGKKKHGCKIAIHNNIIYFQESTIIQPFIRYIYKENKVDLQYLYNPIFLACKCYLDSDNPLYININNLFINAQNGLIKLSEIYKNYTIITHAIYMYNNIITLFLENKFKDHLFIKDNMSYLYDEDLIKKFKNIWNNDRIKMVLDMLEYIEKDKMSEKSIKCLEEFMITIDDETKNII